MDNATAIQVISGIITSLDDETGALQMALEILQNGYQSDMTAARAEVQTETNALNEQVTSLTGQIAAANSETTAATDKISAALVALEDTGAPDDATRVANGIAALS